jgi:hypothetical protein
MKEEPCFACGRPGATRMVDTRDDQIVRVGSDCYRKIESAGEKGYQPPRGGPRLYLMKEHPRC